MRAGNKGFCRKGLHALGHKNIFLGKLTRCLQCHLTWVDEHKSSIDASAAKYKASKKYKDHLASEHHKRISVTREFFYRKRVKAEALSHYGKQGRCQCSWRGCLVSDPDVLTLDHVLNNGAEERRKGQPHGKGIYTWVRINNFPKGFQTLCWNHQWKKRILLLRRTNAFAQLRESD
jgi:hypothetical protein